MVRVLIIYATMSGNTEEVARLLYSQIPGAELYSINDYLYGQAELPDIDRYDTVLIGSYTWDHGSTPHDVKDFIADLGRKPAQVYVFGTGDTQFGGDDLFCAATDKLARFFDSPAMPLKIEQSPRGAQETKVYEWGDFIVKQSTSIKSD